MYLQVFLGNATEDDKRHWRETEILCLDLIFTRILRIMRSFSLRREWWWGIELCSVPCLNRNMQNKE